MVDLVRSAVLIPVPDCRRTWFTRFFFFQAEDGIRDYKVTGVQTCALPISASGTISAANGGTVNLSYSYLGPLILPITVKATLTIPPGAVAQNTTITMTMDQSRVLVYFSPDGLVFSKPALLDVKVTGLTLSNLLFGQQAGCYWYDPNKQVWVQMPAQSIVSDLLHLTFVAQSAQVPHFSRYGFGR